MPGRFVLFPSPLVARRSFLEPLAGALREGGAATAILSVVGESNAEILASAARQIGRIVGDERFALVPFSGAGPLVPPLLGAFDAGQASVVFMDSTLPHPGRPRLDELRDTLPAATFEEFERDLRVGASWPLWTDNQIAALVPDAETRRSLLALSTPRPLAFFAEVLPAANVPPGLPSGYLRLSPAYDASLATARAVGWPTHSLDLTHFAPYTHPEEVARELAALREEVHSAE